MKKSCVLTTVVVVLIIGAMGCQRTGDEQAQWPGRVAADVAVAGDGVTLTDWLVLGAFPNPEMETAGEDGATRAGYGTDYLVDLGGEPQAVLAPETTVRYETGAGQRGAASTQLVTADAEGQVHLEALYEPSDKRLAYAFTYLYSPREQEMTFMVGSDDWAKIYVNGELMLSNWAGSGRGCVPRSESFDVALERGLNTVLVKIDNNSGPWGFIVEVFSRETAERHRSEEKRRKRLASAQIDLDSYIIWGEELPQVFWATPDMTDDDGRALPLTVRWFDVQLNEVEKAANPGRYGCYVESETPDGMTLRWAATAFKPKAGFSPWQAVPDVDLGYVESGMYSHELWLDLQDFANRWAREQVLESLYGEGPGGATLLAGLYGREPQGRPATQLEWPSTLDQDYHLALKRKILGVNEDTWPALRRPHTRSGAPAPVVRDGSLDDAEMKADIAQRVAPVCQAWVEATDIPCTVLVARHGVIAFHEAFGREDGEAITTEQRYRVASLTKTHAGIMLAQFVDQGLISMEDPVGKFLPDYPVEGPRAITLRHCQAHTTGFSGHGEYGGMSNPWLENNLARELPWLEPGTSYLYNGMGFDLSGKVMEMVSGESIFRLMQTHLFLPLGNDGVTIEDLGYGIRCRVQDLVRVGQLLLNRGSYGDLEFFSEETFNNQVLPRGLHDYFPGVEESGGANQKYNMGLYYWEEQREAPEGKTGALILSENTIGHGAASGAILRVDLDNDLVVAMCRPQPGPDYEKWTVRFLTAVADSMK